MTRPVVAMAVRNGVVHDTRVLREARALADVGYDVVIVGLRRADLGESEERDGVRIVRVEPQSVLLTLLTKVLLAPGAADRSVKRLVRRARMLRHPGQDVVVARTALSGVFGFKSRLLRIALGPLRTGLRAYAFQVTAGRAMAALRPVAYHCHDFHTVWAGRTAARIHPAPVLYDAHELYLHQNLPRFTRRRKVFVRFFEGMCARSAAAVITVNGSIAEYLERAYAIPRPVVVRNIPAGTPATTPVPSLPALAGSGPILLYLGGITTGRGIASVIRALPEVPDARLVCMGPVVRETTRDGFISLARSLGVDDRVRFEPPVAPEHVVAVSAQATVGVCLIEDVCLSYRLSLPNKLFECMHAGLPIVGSDFPEIAGLIERYGFGLTCDPADPSAIASAIRKIIDDPALASAMSAKALAAAAEHTWEHEATVLQDLYARIAPIGAA